MTAAIDPDAIPGGPDAVALDPEAVEQAAADLRADAGRIRDAGAELPRTWRGLGAHYEAPESAQLLAAMDPVERTAADYADGLERLAAALASFATDLREVKAGFDRVRADATVFRTKIAGNLEWEFDQDLIHENNRLLGAANASMVALQDAERRCVNQIRAIDCIAPLHVSTGAENDPQAYGTSYIPLDTPMPWGESVARQDHCPKSAAIQVKRAVWDGFVDDVLFASVEGLVAFTGWDLETGDYSAETREQAVNGLGLLVGHDAETGEQSWAVFGSTWTEVGKGLIAWDMWEEDPARAVGTTLGNIGLLVASGGAGVATKVGTAGKLGGALKVAQAVNVVNRVLDPLEWVASGAKATASLREVMAGLGRGVDVDLPEVDLSPVGAVDAPDGAGIAGATRPGGGEHNPAPARAAEPVLENPGVKADNPGPGPGGAVFREPVLADAALSAAQRVDERVLAGVGAQADTVLEHGGQPDVGPQHGGGGPGHGGSGGSGDGGYGSTGGGAGDGGGPGDGPSDLTGPDDDPTVPGSSQVPKTNVGHRMADQLPGRFALQLDEVLAGQDPPLTRSSFTEMVNKDLVDLDRGELETLLKVRDELAPVTPDTVLQKIVNPDVAVRVFDDLAKTVDSSDPAQVAKLRQLREENLDLLRDTEASSYKPTSVGGFVARAVDTFQMATKDIYNYLGLGYSGTPFDADGGAMFALEFQAGDMVPDGGVTHGPGGTASITQSDYVARSMLNHYDDLQALKGDRAAWEAELKKYVHADYTGQVADKGTLKRMVDAVSSATPSNTENPYHGSGYAGHGGMGFTGYGDNFLPELQMLERPELNEGAELWRITPDGTRKAVAHLVETNKKLKWVLL
ncbi:WXG100 family type VII secretion target [Promicromonospora sp. NPDC057488]|uniref:WXG100 family type VII secretion target n=1 Tax=Promicromonospora sp. NPDC057488 TaxID=3346147 RepID=UPI00366C079F